MLAYKEWDEALTALFLPMSFVGGLRVRALPPTVQATKEVEDDVTWLFPEWKGLGGVTGSAYLFEVTLIITIYLSKRYDLPSASFTSVEAIENWILERLCGYALPRSRSPLLPVSRKLFAPDRGKWYSEMRFSFQTQGQAEDDPLQSPPVTEIQLEEQPSGGILWRLP